MVGARDGNDALGLGWICRGHDRGDAGHRSNRVQTDGETVRRRYLALDYQRFIGFVPCNPNLWIQSRGELQRKKGCERSMSTGDAAISIRGLGKSYQIEHGRPRSATFRDLLMDRMRHPLRRSNPETFWAL